MLASGMSLPEPLLSTPDPVHTGFPSLPRTLARAGPTLLVSGVCRLGPLPPVPDLLHSGSSLSLRSHMRLELAILVYGMAQLGLSPPCLGPCPLRLESVAEDLLADGLCTSSFRSVQAGQFFACAGPRACWQLHAGKDSCLHGPHIVGVWHVLPWPVLTTSGPCALRAPVISQGPCTAWQRSTCLWHCLS